MKKFLSVLAVVLVATSLFAAGTVKVGAAFEPITGNTEVFKFKEITLNNSKSTYKSLGFGFDVSGSYAVKGNLSMWADFSMVFCSDAKTIKTATSSETSYDELYKAYQVTAKANNGKASKAINILSFATGTSVKLSLNAPVDIKLGGGVFFERLLAKASLSIPATSVLSGENSRTWKSINIGLAGYADVSYRINEKFGIGLTVMPHFGLYNITTDTRTVRTNSLEYKASGFAFSFSIPVVLGVTYAF